MRILVVHNFYQQSGGEDQCFFAEMALLRSKGHEVDEYSLHNDAIASLNPASVAARAIWNQTTHRQLKTYFRERRPAVAHFHNTFPLISPSAYYAARSEGVPVIQTLHNFRLVCAGATLFREGVSCELCLQRTLKWPAVAHACYRGSRLASASVVAMQSLHGLLDTWNRAVDIYVALTQFSKNKLIEGGLQERKIVVKPNFSEEPGEVGRGDGGFALFVGRLAPEKGIVTLLEAWRRLNGSLRLRIVGDGPLAPLVQQAAACDPAIEWLGAKSPDEVRPLMAAAEFLVTPSLWYEMFPRVIAEAFSVGTPVLTSRIGSLAEIVEHDVTGFHFEAGDAEALAARCVQLSRASTVRDRFRLATRQVYERRLSPQANYQQLMRIYSLASESWAARTGAARRDAYGHSNQGPVRE